MLSWPWPARWSASPRRRRPSKLPAAANSLWRVGVGGSLNGSGDYLVLKAHLEYAPPLGAHVRSASRLAYLGNSRPIELGGCILGAAVV